MLNGRFHCGQGFIISEFPPAVLAPITLDALKGAKLDYVW
jgi:hypothetical protein